MRVSDKAIVLQSVKHGDNKFIVKLYTHNNGLVTAAAIAGKSPSSKIRHGHLLPLNFINAELVLKQNRDIQQLTEASCYQGNPGLPGSITKLSIAQLMNEVLIKCLREHHPNQHLFEFIETCFDYLNSSEEDFMSLHLYFLTELTRYLGFEPQNNYSSNTPYFDCRNGSFTSLSLAFPLGLNKEDSLLLSEFLKINALRTRISNQQRRIMLDFFVAYYNLHVPGFNDIKSLEVLKDVMYS
jgi:DNA repair protein RecO (recombination protein O)